MSMSWSALEEEFVPTAQRHPSSPNPSTSRVGNGFAERRASGCHNPLLKSAATPADHAATRLRMATVQQHPCLPSLGQQEPPLDIPLARTATCACASSATTASPPSSFPFPARLPASASASALAIFHPHSVAPAIYRPQHAHAERPPTAMSLSASLVHPKLDALPALDMESDRLARACGQGPSFSTRSSLSHDEPRANTSTSTSTWDSRPRSPERRGHRQPPSSSSQAHGSPPRWEYPDFSGLGLGPAPGPSNGHGHGHGHGQASPRGGIRPRPHSVRVPVRVSPVPPIPHRPRSFSQPASIPVFAPSSPRAVLRSLQAALERDDAQQPPLGECVDVQGVLERWAAHRRVHVHSAAGVEGSPTSRAGQRQRQRQEGVPENTRTFGAPVDVAVKCASMSTVLGGFQHPIPWVVYACVEELNRTGIYQPGLFRAVPHRSRLEKLISGFDCALPLPRPAARLGPASAAELDSPCPPCAPTASSTRASLRKESMADVCALFKSYMDSLPEPLIHENIASALYRLCVEPSEKREQEKEGKSACESGDGYFHLPPSISQRASDLVNGNGTGISWTHGSRPRSNPASPSPLPSPLSPLSPILMTPSERRSADLSLENAQVRLAQHLLRLAPPPLCSLFAYLCAFFTQLPLSPDNGIALDDVARMFGRSLAGGPTATRNAVLMWLLERWPRVADGLFSIAGADEGGDEDVAPGSSVFPPFAPALVSTTDRDSEGAAAQSPDGTPHVPYSAPSLSPESEVSGGGVEARRRGSLVSLDGAESVFTASTAESDDGVHGVRTPFSSEFPTVPLPAVREYESELGWEEPSYVRPMLNGGVENGMIAGLGSGEMLALDAKSYLSGSFDSKHPAISTSRTDSLRSTSPHSPPPESESDSPSPSSAVHSRSASRASGISDVTTTPTTTATIGSRYRSDSPLSILKRLGFRESSPHRSASVRKKKNAAAHRRAGSDGEPQPAALNGTVEH